MTPSPDAPEVYEIYDISSPHMVETEEYIWIFDIEEKILLHFHANIHRWFSFEFCAKFTSNCFESEEKIDFFPSNVAAGVQICDTLDILEEISDYKSETFAPHDLDLLANSCRIACTKI